MKKNRLSILVVFTLVYSCNHSSIYNTKETLELAGENRVELEKVLNYFRDSNKVAYESACFLIENMKYHKSKDMIIPDSSHIDYFKRTDSLYRAIFQHMPSHVLESFKEEDYAALRKELGEEFNRLPQAQITYNINLPDAQNLSALFLIDNIKQALDIWHKKTINILTILTFSKNSFCLIALQTNIRT